MPEKPETKLQRKIQVAIEGWCQEQDLPCFGYKVHGNPYQIAGLPDLIYCISGRFVGIEVKLPGKGPTKLQKATLSMLNDAGAIVGVATTPGEACDLISDAFPSDHSRPADETT